VSEIAVFRWEVQKTALSNLLQFENKMAYK